MRESILGLDIGTTSTKAVLFDLSGAEIATAQRAYPLQTPQAGWVEQDPELLWNAVVETIREVTTTTAATFRISALALAAQSGSLIPADARGEPVYPAITWMDSRSEALVERWRAEGVEGQVRQISGWSLTPGLCLPTIAWLRQFKPDISARAKHFFSVNDFLVHRLTGQFCMNVSNAAGVQLIDIATGDWSDALCNLAGITVEQLSPIRPTGAPIGKITERVSRLTGLPPDTQVINGGHDQVCTALGIGVTAPGEVLLACGTAWVLTTVVDQPVIDSVPPSFNISFHALPQRWTAGQSLGGLGASLEWWVNRRWAESSTLTTRSEMYAALDAQLEKTTLDDNGLFFLPPAGGHDSPASGRPGGFVGLRLDHTPADMARSILEGAAFELRWALEDMQQAGMPIEQVSMVGGAAQSPIWPDIIANITGGAVALPQYQHWPALGAAILAGVGAGEFETIEAGQTRFKQATERVTPDEKLTPIYEARFKAYRQLVYDYRKLL